MFEKRDEKFVEILMNKQASDNRLKKLRSERSAYLIFFMVCFVIYIIEGLIFKINPKLTLSVTIALFALCYVRDMEIKLLLVIKNGNKSTD